jgi:hypothetical protein
MATNETSEETTLVNQLHNKWVEAGSKPASPAEAKRLIAAYNAAAKALTAAEEAHAAAQKAVGRAVTDIVLARGKGSFLIAGVKHTPMSKGQTVYFRVESSKELDSFG